MPCSLGGAPVRNDVRTSIRTGRPRSRPYRPVDSAFISENRKQQARKFHEALGR